MDRRRLRPPRELNDAISPDAVRGGRYPEAMMALLDN